MSYTTLPYCFDLLFDIKSLEHLREVYDTLNDDDQEEIDELCNIHNIEL